MANGTNPQARRHDLDHEVYIDPKDHKEHINHGMLEYSKEDLESAHAYYDEYHLSLIHISEPTRPY